jgi:hypothetical protein
MTTKTQELPDYWSIYKAINFKRFSTNRHYIDAKTGKEMEYNFVNGDMIQESIFLQVFSAIMWMSPAFLIVVISALYLQVTAYSMFIGIFFVIGYHFAAMYFVIRGPYLTVKPIKKGLFSRK